MALFFIVSFVVQNLSARYRVLPTGQISFHKLCNLDMVGSQHRFSTLKLELALVVEQI